MTTVVKPLTYGRMGNFLFQAAAAMAYAWRHNLEYTLPSTTNNPRANPIYLQHLVNRNFDPGAQSITLTETTHAYQELAFSEDWRGRFNIILDGYWQSEKYFKEFRGSILNAFAFPWKPMKGFVSVHVRRGDYLKLINKHPPVPARWIAQAMDRFPGYHYVFFSDDIPWCKSVFGRRRDVTFSEGKSEVQDLIEMSWCEHHVCSCSTFSWWGAWLNQNPDKKIVMPKNWFQPGRKEDTRDIVPTEWERL